MLEIRGYDKIKSLKKLTNPNLITVCLKNVPQKHV